jgi:hypothetical protein
LVGRELIGSSVLPYQAHGPIGPSSWSVGV